MAAASSSFKMLRHVLALLLIAAPASAQDTVRTGRTVRATLTDGSSITGRLTGGDSATLTIEAAGSIRIVDRKTIATLSARSHRSGPPRILGTIGAVLGGLLIDTWSCMDGCKNEFVAFSIGAIGGGTILSSLGSSIGAALPRWDTVSALSSVDASADGRFGVATCMRNQQWTTETGIAGRRGYSVRGMGTFFCEPEMMSGIEVGYLAQPYAIRAEQPYPCNCSGLHGTALSDHYIGFVSERSIGHLPLDPRLLTSLEWHNGASRESWDIHNQSSNTRSFNDRIHSNAGPGLGLGFSLGFNPVRQMSVRTAVRMHMMYSGVVNTLSIGAEWRP